jgi:hypothetical protein
MYLAHSRNSGDANWIITRVKGDDLYFSIMDGPYSEMLRGIMSPAEATNLATLLIDTLTTIDGALNMATLDHMIARLEECRINHPEAAPWSNHPVMPPAVKEWNDIVEGLGEAVANRYRAATHDPDGDFSDLAQLAEQDVPADVDAGLCHARSWDGTGIGGAFCTLLAGHTGPHAAVAR